MALVVNTGSVLKPTLLRCMSRCVSTCATPGSASSRTYWYGDALDGAGAGEIARYWLAIPGPAMCLSDSVCSSGYPAVCLDLGMWVCGSVW